MNEEELNAQLEAATQFIIDAKTEAENFKTAAEAYRALTEKAIEAMSKRPEAIITTNVLDNVAQTVYQAATTAVSLTKCSMPSVDAVSKDIAKLVLAEISNRIDEAVSASVKRHSTRIDVHHEHYHTNRYGGFASSEKNRRVMCWLGSVTFICIVQMALLVGCVFDIFHLNMNYLVWSFVITIVVAIVGFFIRITSEYRY